MARLLYMRSIYSVGRRYSNSFENMMPTTGADISEDIGGMRIKYKDKRETFLESDLVSKEPIGQFKAWFDDACKTPGILEANAMCLATSSKDGMPSARYVLLKGYGKDGFKFFTNQSSKKGCDLAENPHAALTFYWEPLKRSVRVEGKVEKISVEESDVYFHSRPRESQIGACVSNQSKVIAGREELAKRQEEIEAKYPGNTTIPRPQDWGGYRVIPMSMEFWQGQSDRVHDRILFRRADVGTSVNGVTTFQGDEDWVYERLAP